MVRTTLDIDDDVLQAAKELAARGNKTAGQVISELARLSIINQAPPDLMAATVVNGFELLPAGGRRVTPDLVRCLLEEVDDA